MPRERLAYALLALCGLGLASPAAAQVPVRLEVTPQIGYFDFHGDRSTNIDVNEDALAYQMRLGLVFPGNWGLEASGGLIPSTFVDQGVRRDSRSFVIGAAGTYRFVNSSPFTPFVLAGAEILDLDATGGEAEANPAFAFGGGLHVATASRVGLRLDVKTHVSKVTGCPNDRPPGPPANNPGRGNGNPPNGRPCGPPSNPPGRGNPGGPNRSSAPWLQHFEVSLGLVWRPW